MLSDLLLRQLNKLRISKALCDIELVSCEKKSVPMHQLVFVAYNNRHLQEALKCQYSLGNPSLRKKMYFINLTTSEIEMFVEFMYGCKVTTKNMYTRLKLILEKVDMAYLLDEVEQPVQEDMSTVQEDISIKQEVEPLQSDTIEGPNSEFGQNRLDPFLENPDEDKTSNVNCQTESMPSVPDFTQMKDEPVLHDNSIDASDKNCLKTKENIPDHVLINNEKSEDTETVRNIIQAEEQPSINTVHTIKTEPVEITCSAPELNTNRWSDKKTAADKCDEETDAKLRSVSDIENLSNPCAFNDIKIELNADYVEDTSSSNNAKTTHDIDNVKSGSSSGKENCIPIENVNFPANKSVVINNFLDNTKSVPVSSDREDNSKSSPSNLRKLSPKLDSSLVGLSHIVTPHFSQPVSSSSFTNQMQHCQISTSKTMKPSVSSAVLRSLISAKTSALTSTSSVLSISQSNTGRGHVPSLVTTVRPLSSASPSPKTVSNTTALSTTKSGMSFTLSPQTVLSVHSIIAVQTKANGVLPTARQSTNTSGIQAISDPDRNTLVTSTAVMDGVSQSSYVPKIKLEQIPTDPTSLCSVISPETSTLMSKEVCPTLSISSNSGMPFTSKSLSVASGSSQTSLQGAKISTKSTVSHSVIKDLLSCPVSSFVQSNRFCTSSSSDKSVALSRRKPLFKKSEFLSMKSSNESVEDKADLASKDSTEHYESDQPHSFEENQTEDIENSNDHVPYAIDQRSPVFEKDDGTESNDLNETDILVESATAFVKLKEIPNIKQESDRNGNALSDTDTDVRSKNMPGSNDENDSNLEKTREDMDIQSKSHKCNIPSSEIVTLNAERIEKIKKKIEKEKNVTNSDCQKPSILDKNTGSKVVELEASSNRRKNFPQKSKLSNCLPIRLEAGVDSEDIGTIKSIENVKKVTLGNNFGSHSTKRSNSTVSQALIKTVVRTQQGNTPQKDVPSVRYEHNDETTEKVHSEKSKASFSSDKEKIEMNSSFNDFLTPVQAAAKPCIIPTTEICTLSPDDIRGAKRKQTYIIENRNTLHQRKMLIESPLSLQEQTLQKNIKENEGVNSKDSDAKDNQSGKRKDLNKFNKNCVVNEKGAPHTRISEIEYDTLNNTSESSGNFESAKIPSDSKESNDSDTQIPKLFVDQDEDEEDNENNIHDSQNTVIDISHSLDKEKQLALDKCAVETTLSLQNNDKTKNSERHLVEGDTTKYKEVKDDKITKQSVCINSPDILAMKSGHYQCMPSQNNFGQFSPMSVAGKRNVLPKCSVTVVRFPLTLQVENGPSGKAKLCTMDKPVFTCVLDHNSITDGVKQTKVSKESDEKRNIKRKRHKSLSFINDMKNKRLKKSGSVGQLASKSSEEITDISSCDHQEKGKKKGKNKGKGEKRKNVSFKNDNGVNGDTNEMNSESDSEINTPLSELKERIRSTKVPNCDLLKTPLSCHITSDLDVQSSKSEIYTNTDIPLYKGTLATCSSKHVTDSISSNSIESLNKKPRTSYAFENCEKERDFGEFLSTNIENSIKKDIVETSNKSGDPSQIQNLDVHHKEKCSDLVVVTNDSADEETDSADEGTDSADSISYQVNKTENIYHIIEEAKHKQFIRSENIDHTKSNVEETVLDLISVATKKDTFSNQRNKSKDVDHITEERISKKQEPVVDRTSTSSTFSEQSKKSEDVDLIVEEKNLNELDDVDLTSTASKKDTISFDIPGVIQREVAWRGDISDNTPELKKVLMAPVKNSVSAISEKYDSFVDSKKCLRCNIVSPVFPLCAKCRWFHMLQKESSQKKHKIKENNRAALILTKVLGKNATGTTKEKIIIKKVESSREGNVVKSELGILKEKKILPKCSVALTNVLASTSNCATYSNSLSDFNRSTLSPIIATTSSTLSSSLGSFLPLSASDLSSTDLRCPSGVLTDLTLSASPPGVVAKSPSMTTLLSTKTYQGPRVLIFKAPVHRGANKLTQSETEKTGNMQISEQAKMSTEIEIQRLDEIKDPIQTSKSIVNNKSVAGDVLVMTKPLGTHVAMVTYQLLQQPEKQGILKDLVTKEDVSKMYHHAQSVIATSNEKAVSLLKNFNYHGFADVGDQDLLHCASNLAAIQRNNVSFVIHNLPVIAKTSAISIACRDIFNQRKEKCTKNSGGLLIVLPKEEVEIFCKQFRNVLGQQAWVIGMVVEGNHKAVLSDEVKLIEVENEVFETAVYIKKEPE